MSDWGAELVEAIAKALHASVDTSAAMPWDELDWRTQVRWLNRGSVALDALLANGGEIREAREFYRRPRITFDEPGRYLVCRLDSDSRDTGEKP